MADPDPESEALIRQLHRELNGLTRRSRQPASNLAGIRKIHADKKGHESVTPSDEASDKAASRPASEGEPSADKEPQPKAKRERPADAAERQERSAKVQRKGSPQRDTSKSKAGADKGAAGVPAPPAVPLTPLEAAASLASTLTRSKAKQSGPVNGSRVGGHIIKCFHAGIRWGITLASDSIKKRSDLAAALNDAYAGQILSCGRGEMLHVVFLDHEGQAVEFPALRSDAKESASKWRACVETAVRIYVMR